MRRTTARVLPGAPRSAVGCFCRQRLSLLGRLGVAGATPKPKRRGYSDRTSERSRDLVGVRVVSEAKRDGKLVSTSLSMLVAPCMFYSVLVAVGPRAAAAPVALSRGWWISPVKQSTTRFTLPWLASVSRTCYVELDKLPQLIE